jgi:hypothetical protein
LNSKEDDDKYYGNIKKSYIDRIKMPYSNFNMVKKDYCTDYNVKRDSDLAQDYLGKFVKISEITNLKIIKKNQSVILKCDDTVVGAVIRDAAKKTVSEYFGRILKETVDAYPKLNRGQNTHADSGKLVGHGYRANFLNPSTYDTYVLKEKDPELQKIFVDDGDSFGIWLYNFAKIHLPWSTVSYETFKKKINLNLDNKLIGAVFCAENYEAAGHRDRDKSDMAIGYVFEDGIVKEGYFIYPEYGVAIELTSNTIWCWLTKAVHGMAKLDLSEGGIRYTAAITLTEKTAKAIEKQSGIME